MIQIRKALYIVDFDNPSVGKHIEQILGSALFAEATVTFLVVIPAGRNWGIFANQDVQVEKVERALAEDARAQLEDMVSSAKPSTAKTEIRVLTGRPTEVLPAFMKLEPHDLIIKAPNAEYSTLDKVFARQDLRLIRSCSTPMLIIRPWDDFTKVMVAVDLKVKDEFLVAFNHFILSCAAGVALTKQCELHIVHAWRLYGESMLSSGRAKIANEKFIKLMKEEEESRRQMLDELREYLAQIVKRSTGIELKPVTHLVKGNATDVVPTMVKKVGAGLLVIGTVSRQGVKAVVMGNTAESIIHKTDASILTVSP